MPGTGLDPNHLEARAWIALQIELALAPEAAVRSLRALGDPRRALARERPGAKLPESRIDAARDAFRSAGASLLPFQGQGYPERLLRIADPPVLLGVLGDPRVLSAPSVAIVGARAASVYGLSVARSLAASLAAAGVVVVSGLARGVDAAAHEGALAAGGCSVAVQACGLDRVYPAAHRGLARRIAARGAVLSEMPPGTPPRGPYFPLRNRIISGLCAAVVVVEARHRSGSLVTARHALAQGVEVLAVPGPVDVPTSEGPNALLRDGAAPVLDASDVLAVFGLSPAERPAPTPLPASQRAIVDALHHEQASADELARRLRRPVAELALDLVELEIGGRVRCDRDGRLRAL